MSINPKRAFLKKYQGPTGAHLSCLTQTSMVGDYELHRQSSIHPTGRHKMLHKRRDGKAICAEPRAR